MTDQTRQLFIDLWKDAPNWSGTPYIDCNVILSAEGRGNLSHLKMDGLIGTQKDGRDVFVYFTPAGEAFAAQCGLPRKSW